MGRPLLSPEPVLRLAPPPRPGCDLPLITRSPAATPLLPRPRKLQNAELIKSSISTLICRIHYLSKMPSIAFSPSPYIFGSKLLQALSCSQDTHLNGCLNKLSLIFDLFFYINLLLMSILRK